MHVCWIGLVNFVFDLFTHPLLCDMPLQLMEAHESQLRGLALTADGSKVATASEKGTVIRVWDVAAAACLQEFRRGVERATITCLSWSWDHSHLCCTSDKGTAHIFQLDGATDTSTTNDEKKNSEHSSSALSMTQKLFSSMRKSVEGDAKKSISQIRGVPHPMACAFVSSATNLVAVAGWDADGNGVLLLSEYKTSVPNEEPRRVGYHVLCKSSRSDETEEARRRRRLRGWTPEIPPTPEGGRLYVGERLELLERGMEQIHFTEGGKEDDEFVSVSTVVQCETIADVTADIDTQLESSLAGSDTTENVKNHSNPTNAATPPTPSEPPGAMGEMDSSAPADAAEDDDDPNLYESATS
jgi:hypothetical protein